jgi:hypothetical protein
MKPTGGCDIDVPFTPAKDQGATYAKAQETRSTKRGIPEQ